MFASLRQLTYTEGGANLLWHSGMLLPLVICRWALAYSFKVESNYRTRRGWTLISTIFVESTPSGALITTCSDAKAKLNGVSNGERAAKTDAGRGGERTSSPNSGAGFSGAMHRSSTLGNATGGTSQPPPPPPPPHPSHHGRHDSVVSSNWAPPLPPPGPLAPPPPPQHDTSKLPPGAPPPPTSAPPPQVRHLRPCREGCGSLGDHVICHVVVSLLGM